MFVGSYAIGDGWILLKDVLFRIPQKGGPSRELLDKAVQVGVNQTRVGIATGGLSQDDVQAIASLMRATGSKTN